MVKRSAAAIMGPGRIANRPTGMPGMLCIPNTSCTPKRSMRPSFTMASPPPPPSSAGWKITTAVPSKLRVSARYSGGPEQHGGVPVVAAGVHPAGNVRLVGRAGRLRDRQRVHVGAKADDAAACVRLAPDDPDDAGAPDPGFDRVAAERPQFVGHDARGAVDVEEKLGMRMEIAPPGGDLVGEVGDAVDDGHGLNRSREGTGRRRT